MDNATVIIRAFAVRVFHIRGFSSVSWGASISYPRPNFKACRQAFFRFVGECDANDKLRVKELRRQYSIKIATFIRFSLRAFSLYATIRRSANPMCNVSHLHCIVNNNNNNYLAARMCWILSFSVIETPLQRTSPVSLSLYFVILNSSPLCFHVFCQHAESTFSLISNFVKYGFWS
jgi:hypothetical protein